jgi:hypothetical protein
MKKKKNQLHHLLKLICVKITLDLTNNYYLFQMNFLPNIFIIIIIIISKKK